MSVKSSATTSITNLSHTNLHIFIGVMHNQILHVVFETIRFKTLIPFPENAHFGFDVQRISDPLLVSRKTFAAVLIMAVVCISKYLEPLGFIPTVVQKIVSFFNDPMATGWFTR